MKSLALFDFDGTLTTSDTLLVFLKFYKGSAKFYLGFLLLAPVIILFKVGLIRNDKAKQIVLRFFLGSEDFAVFQSGCEIFAKTKLPGLLRPEAMAKLKMHQTQGDDVYIISASPENWILSFSKNIGVELLATRLEVVGGKITGNIVGENCYGAEKVIRIKKVTSLESYHSISAYGDSAGDKEMLAIATNPYYQKFN